MHFTRTKTYCDSLLGSPAPRSYKVVLLVSGWTSWRSLLLKGWWPKGDRSERDRAVIERIFFRGERGDLTKSCVHGGSNFFQHSQLIVCLRPAVLFPCQSSDSYDESSKGAEEALFLCAFMGLVFVKENVLCDLGLLLNLDSTPPLCQASYILYKNRESERILDRQPPEIQTILCYLPATQDFLSLYHPRQKKG